MNAIDTTLQIIANLYAQRRIYYHIFGPKTVTFCSYKQPYRHMYTYEEFATKFASLA